MDSAEKPSRYFERGPRYSIWTLKGVWWGLGKPEPQNILHCCLNDYYLSKNKVFLFMCCVASFFVHKKSNGISIQVVVMYANFG
jgi:hypothetical protein